MVDDVASNDAAHALIDDVDDDVAGRVTEAGLHRDAVVESVVVIDQHDLSGLLYRQHAVLEADAMDARVASSIGRVPIIFGAADDVLGVASRAFGPAWAFSP